LLFLKKFALAVVSPAGAGFSAIEMYSRRQFSNILL